ncbi:methyl-viologen-reducing hydrogenase subunit delta [Methanosarcinales archaeon ex4572_44]|nr:MAG: methyl-viologen-reducing hydrogenase subunit delta [Methanosarcinales archaeon ex4572_44]RLG26298.1 MAG: methyl-viologen-reducing hydrogenase subunit delta [Methanosarcinales archaeon]RLG27282.1 MAG: methyl-viologen-reducing hydrogenase subunit delta [Methanosarcinales archaeon]HHI30765.1 hydrogenase iron-sulfur subunit [Candidatus Methanoperedenaceae archaeon]
MAEDFEPKIVVFACNWCTYTGADLAGTSRQEYPPNVRVIRLMCSGRADPVFLIKALVNGADGVFVGGCHPGDCHYTKGNYYARRRINALQKILEQFGLAERTRLQWLSASEGPQFAQAMTKMTEDIKKLGPNPLKEALV